MCRCRSYANLRAQPVGLRHKGEHLIKAHVPAVLRHDGRRRRRAWSRTKFGDDGIYSDAALFDRIYKDEFGDDVPERGQRLRADVIACTRDICTYIYETHGRFPAHCDTIHVPGVWLQVHHLELDITIAFFQNGLTDAHRANDQNWPS